MNLVQPYKYYQTEWKPTSTFRNYVNKIKEVKGDTKKLWHILNKITNKVYNKNNAIDVLKCNGTNVTDNLQYT